MSSRLIARLSLAGVAVLALAAAATGAAAPRFYPDDPLWTDDDRAFGIDPKKVVAAELSEGFDFLENSFGKPGDRRQIRAFNINTLDEVPDSSWFTNRIGRGGMTLADIERGPDTIARFDVTDWIITRDKGPAGFQPGFRARDARDTRPSPQIFQLEGDTEDYPELASGSEMIGTFIYHALGYNVVDTYIVNVDPKRLKLAPNASFRDGSGRRAFRQADLDAILRMLAKNPDGSIRMTASRFVEGRPLEAFRYYGTRPDDPNDIYPHEHRRELRANRVFGAWLNHDDSRAINTLDMLVEEGGRHWIKHYMFDFGSLMGSSPDRRWSGVEYLYEAEPTWKALVTFGFWLQPWQFVKYPRGLPSAAIRFEGDAFDPAAWKPEYPNAAFDNMQPDDAFWGARLVASFTDEAIAAIVRKARYSDPRAASHITETLIKRRDKIAKVWLTAVNPVVDFSLGNDGTLSFRNAATDARVAAPGVRYTLAWSEFDNATDSHRPVGSEEDVAEPRGRMPQALTKSAFVSVAVRARHQEYPVWNQPVTVYFRRDGSGWTTVGLDRR